MFVFKVFSDYGGVCTQFIIHTPSDSPIRIIIPYKDQKSADVVRKQLRDLGRKIDYELQPIFCEQEDR